MPKTNGIQTRSSNIINDKNNNIINNVSDDEISNDLMINNDKSQKMI